MCGARGGLGGVLDTSGGVAHELGVLGLLDEEAVHATQGGFIAASDETVDGGWGRGGHTVPDEKNLAEPQMPSRLASLVSVMVTAAMACIGMMYILDSLQHLKANPRGVAVVDVASWASAIVAVDPAGPDSGIPLRRVIERLRASRALCGVPVLVLERADVVAHRRSILVAEGAGVECVAIVVDEPDPSRAIRRVWVLDASVVDRFRYTRDVTREDRVAFHDPGVVEGGDVFGGW